MVHVGLKSSTSHYTLFNNFIVDVIDYFVIYLFIVYLFLIFIDVYLHNV